MKSLIRDVRYSVRLLLRTPGATAVALLTLALGIGANAAIFSAVYAILLRPLPVRDADRVAVIAMNNAKLGAVGAQPSYARYAQWQEYGRVFASVAAAAPGSGVLDDGGAGSTVRVWRVTGSFLPVLGVAPAMGRNFSAAEDQPGGGGVALVSDGWWRSRCREGAPVLGARITIDHAAYTVIGVLPAGFHVDGRPADVYVPMARSLQDPAYLAVTVYARLRDGVSLAQAQAQLDAVDAGAGRSPLGWKPQVWNVRDFQVRDVRRSLWVLLGAVGLVLLIACANTASLLLARTSARRRELAVRVALGAGRGRLLRQLLTESLVLALLGGVCGAGLAALCVRLAPLLAHERLPNLLLQTRVDGVVLAFTAAVSLLTGVVFGTVPALSLAGRDMADWLRTAGRTTRHGGGYRACQALVAAETAVALVLAVAATLLIHSFFYLRDVAPGFRVEGLLVASVNSERTKFARPEQAVSYYRDLLAHVRTIPGLQAASFAQAMPLSGDNWVMQWPIEGVVVTNPREAPVLWQRIVDREYFRTLGIPLLRGRLFTEQDHLTAAKVVVVNESLARRFWPGQEAVGKHIGGGPVPRFEVVGVVGNVRHQDATREAPPEVFFHYPQMPTARVTLALRGDPRVYGSPLRLEAPLRQAVAALDRKQALTNVAEMRQVISDRVASKRLSAQFSGAFAGLALILAAAGVYGVLAFSVSQRTHEMGVRMALGARPRQLLAMVVGQALLPAVCGAAIGAGVSLWLTRLLTGMVYGIRATDPWIYAGAAAAVMAVSAVAAFLPARRAAAVDPVVALRSE